MIDIALLSEEETVEYILSMAKTLRKYSLSAKKSSSSRLSIPMGTSRKRVTSANAKMERDFESYERIKTLLKDAINFF